MKKVISRLPGIFLWVQAVPYFCLLVFALELILAMNIFGVEIDTGLAVNVWCFYCGYCVHIVGIASVMASALAFCVNFREKKSRGKYIAYFLVHAVAAWFTWFWFNALMSV